MELKASPSQDRTEFRSRRDESDPNPECFASTKVKSNHSTSQWFIEARKRKEKALLALKEAKEEVRARQSMSTEGLSLREKKKLRLARLQAAMERREAEAKRDLEERRKEAEMMKLATRKKSKEAKKKAFYSDSSGSESSDDNVACVKPSIEGAMGDKLESRTSRRKEKHKKRKSAGEPSNRKTSVSTPARRHLHRKEAKAEDTDSESSDDGSSLAVYNDAIDCGPAETINKQSYSSYAVRSSSSESSSSEDSADQDVRVSPKVPDESAYIVNTDPSSSETVHSDSSAEVARVIGGRIQRANIERKSQTAHAKSAVIKADENEFMSPTGTKEKAPKTKSPKKTKKSTDAKKSSKLGSPMKIKKSEEDSKSSTRKTPKKSKKESKSPRKSTKVEETEEGRKAMKSLKRVKQKEEDVEKRPHESETAPVARHRDSVAVSPETVTTARRDSLRSNQEHQEGGSAVDLSTASKVIAAGPSEEAQTLQQNAKPSKGWENPLTEWINEPLVPIRLHGPQIQLQVPAGSSCWRETRGLGNLDTAPFHFQTMSGNFEVLCRVSGELSSQYDKAGIMIRIDEANWIMSGLEFSNGRINNTTCVTLGSTDRSVSPLPVNAEKAGIWFCTKRIDGAFECYYSLDLKVWTQTRQGLLPPDSTVSVGICAASPDGPGFLAKFTHFKCRTVQASPKKALI